MVRQVLNTRRANVTCKLPVEMDGGVTVSILVTVGFDKDGRPCEVFCADFKAGTSLHAIIMDACILLSRLLQHGDEPTDLLHAMSDMSHPSLIGALTRLVVEFELKPPEGLSDHPVVIPPKGPKHPDFVTSAEELIT